MPATAPLDSSGEAARVTRKQDGPGVPEAIPRTLQGVVERLGAETVDRIWIFPPRIKGRKESGLVVVSRFTGDDDPERRHLFTVSYTAERTGKGLTVDWGLSEEGAAPPGRLPPIIEGVVRRAGDDEEEAREVGLEGDRERLVDLFDEWPPALLDQTLWPRATDEGGDGDVSEAGASEPVSTGTEAARADGPSVTDGVGRPG